jgi:hypothetical protein
MNYSLWDEDAQRLISFRTLSRRRDHAEDRGRLRRGRQ